MFISIGGACMVKFNLDKFTGKKETLFFDWLITDMNSINKIIGTNDISSILFLENIIRNPNTPNKHGKARVMLKSLSSCESMHDLPANFSSKNVLEFIEKYKRRHNKIIGNIINNNSEIYFIRFGEVKIDEKKTFIKIIKDINLNCKFKLVELVNQKDKNNYLINEDNFMSINLFNYKIKEINQNDWTESHWDWKNILEDIINLNN